MQNETGVTINNIKTMPADRNDDKPSSSAAATDAAVTDTPVKVPNGLSVTAHSGDVVLELPTVIETKEGKGEITGDDDAVALGLMREHSGLRAINGSVISFRDVSYRVDVRSRTKCCSCQKEPQFILKNVRLVVAVDLLSPWENDCLALYRLFSNWCKDVELWLVLKLWLG